MASEIEVLDRDEAQEWLQSFKSVLRFGGERRAQLLLQELMSFAGHKRLPLPLTTEYVNTIDKSDEAPFPDDLALAAELSSILRWNAIAMVLRAVHSYPELGGHLATYASIATLYEVGFNHFFHAPSKEHGGDLVYFQGHSSPGIYARAFSEGRLTEKNLNQFRQEANCKDGLSSYPHPWLMPTFWQFATVSMGLGPLQAIYQARFMKYLHNRGFITADKRKVWCFCGDGEMDEVESLGAITLGARERLDNLIFVVNCNLQRLDGPVRGNGKIIQELEALFRGAGWQVLKVIWGSNWDPILAKDKDGLLKRRMMQVADGDYQRYRAHDGAYIREEFFNTPELKALVADLDDAQIWQLTRGGQDMKKVFAAYKVATETTGRPTVILAKSIKGYGLGEAGESQNITHQQKKMTFEQLKVFRDRFALPLSDADVENLNYYQPGDKHPAIQYLKAQRKKLGGSFPQRRVKSSISLKVPALSEFSAVSQGSGEREISTTMAFVRILSILLKNKDLGQHVVPIVPDESRTFGMEGLFKQVGIYSPVGQLYTPVDAHQLMSYHEDEKGQMLQEGINEAGAFCSWLAAATAYSNHDVPMIPFYIYYSMFGFQRIGDLAWAAGDMQARGFLLGATAGRTTLAGEGLQHQDGHSLVMAATIPNCVAYDPAYAYELAVIIAHGLKRMFEREENVYFYITLMNENYQHPALPAGAEEGIIKGIYCLQKNNAKQKLKVELIGGGTILREVIAAAELLKAYDVSANIWSATSFNELAREAKMITRRNALELNHIKPYISQCFSDATTPVIAATDYIKAYPDQVREYIAAPFHVLGTDGFGRSDTREQLRQFFEVNRFHIAYRALYALFLQEKVTAAQLKAAQKAWQIDIKKPDPITV